MGSWLGSLMCLGGLVATPLYLFISDHYSRKCTGYLVAAPFVASWVLVITAESVAILCLARFIGGMGSGAIIVFASLYVSETAQDTVRGALGSYLTLFTNAGVLFAYILGSYVHYYTFAYIAMLLPVIYTLGMLWIPETPNYLVNREKYSEAERSLRWLRGKDERLVELELNKLIMFAKEQTDERLVELELSKLIIFAKEQTEAVSLKDMLSAAGTRRALIIGVVLAANLQFCGIFAILSYTVNIFQAAGSDLSPNSATILIGSLQLAGSYASSLLIDKAGRKILLLISNICMALCLAALGTYFFVKHQGSDVSDFGWLPVGSLSVYIIAIALGVAPITFLMVSEIFEPRVKGRAIAIIISIMWLLTFLIGKFYTNLSDVLGIYGCYWMFSVCCVLGAIFTQVSVPETKNRSLESILLELSGGRKGQNLKSVQSEISVL
ncbi:Solute carrier family 2, facilitated glucose transporter member 8 [Zootermopsis nevadensis]|uniref:Solute carrier family 2, facilitated glucose transporter member 8 n=1 Tax=Zootermopsis nevadensis TaxID=136037 RepID=A0A067R867_ZOONE|nr:Solute carrier family 2, facilitated glucose transporter member 8 [Zootermopsis nevadensis]